MWRDEHIYTPWHIIAYWTYSEARLTEKPNCPRIFNDIQLFYQQFKSILECIPVNTFFSSDFIEIVTFKHCDTGDFCEVYIILSLFHLHNLTDYCYTCKELSQHYKLSVHAKVCLQEIWACTHWPLCYFYIYINHVELKRGSCSHRSMVVT